jgi:N-acetylmuramoyl-L-alanine amidase
MYNLLHDNDDLDKFSDQEVFAKILWGESRGEPDEGKQAVANVVMNRVKQPGWWGNGVRSVLLKPYQFSCLLNGDPNRPKLVAITAADSIYARCLDIATLAINGILDDVSGGADSYLRTGTTASWARTLKPVKIIGHHSFYRTVKCQTNQQIV